MESRSSDRAKRYDPSMSRRTRKPAAIAAVKVSPGRDGEWGKGADGGRRLSLKDLLREGGGEEGDGVAANTAEGKAVSDQVLAGAAEEELPLPLPLPPVKGGKHLQMVKVRSPGADGVKLAGMVTRCVKVLNHLVKARSGSKKNNAVQFLK